MAKMPFFYIKNLRHQAGLRSSIDRIKIIVVRNCGMQLLTLCGLIKLYRRRFDNQFTISILSMSAPMSFSLSSIFS